MRKVRDYDAELKALGDKARALKAKKVQQLGELVMAVGADTLDLDLLAGGLLHVIAEAQVTENREAWRSDGAAFFQRRGRKTGRVASSDDIGTREAGAGDAQG